MQDLQTIFDAEAQKKICAKFGREIKQVEFYFENWIAETAAGRAQDHGLPIDASLTGTSVGFYTDIPFTEEDVRRNGVFKKIDALCRAHNYQLTLEVIFRPRYRQTPTSHWSSGHCSAHIKIDTAKPYIVADKPSKTVAAKKPHQA